VSKPKIGVIAIAKVNHQKDEIREMVAYLRERLDREEAIEAMVCPEVLFDEYRIQEEARRMEVDGADALLLIVGTWVFSSHAISAVNDLHIPFILFGESEEIANGNFGASLQIRYVLEEMHKKFLYLYGSARDEGNIEKILKFTNAAHVVKAIRNKKIATIGGKCMKNRYATRILAALVMLAVASFGFSVVALAEAPVKIVFWSHFGGEDGTYMDTMLQQFAEANPDIQVENLKVINEDYYTKLKAGITSGQGLDVCTGDADRLVEFKQGGLVQDMTPYAEAVGLDWNNYNPGIVANCTVDGEHLAIPLSSYASIMFVNKTLLD
jgi:hypothetical protein